MGEHEGLLHKTHFVSTYTTVVHSAFVLPQWQVVRCNAETCFPKLWVTACSISVGSYRQIHSSNLLSSDSGLDKGSVFDWHGCSALSLVEANLKLIHFHYQ